MFVFLADDFLLWDLFKCLCHMIGLQIVYQTRGCQQCSSALSVSLCLSVLCVVRIDFSSLPNPPPPTSLFECVQHSVLSPSLSVMYIYSVCRLSSHLSLYLNSLAEAPMFAGLLLRLYSIVLRRPFNYNWTPKWFASHSIELAKHNGKQVFPFFFYFLGGGLNIINNVCDAVRFKRKRFVFAVDIFLFFPSSRDSMHGQKIRANIFTVWLYIVNQTGNVYIYTHTDA